jgi:hypothetical protein
VRYYCLAILLILIPAPASAQTIDYAAAHLQRRLQMVKIHEKITIDGVLDEAPWEMAPVADNFTQQEPNEGVPMSFPTEVKVLYDDVNLYLGVIAHDPDASKAVINDLTKDFRVFDNDIVGIMIDTFRDRKNGYEFIVNPAGARYDSQMSNESDYNSNWDGVWYLRTQILEDRWVAEVAIPFKAIRFLNLEEQTWGINFWRIIRRLNEQGYWAPIPRPFNYSRVSIAGTIEGIEGIHPGTNLRIKPWILTSFGQSGISGVPSTQKVDGGLDVKYGFGTNASLDATFNTDFSQVEADQQQINLTRFSVLFPEKREFFLENSSIFGFAELGAITSTGGNGMSSPGRLSGGGNDLLFFFSRRIGISDDGGSIPVLGGGRLTGRNGPWSFGFMDMATRTSGPTPETNFAVARVKRNVLENSQIGAIFIDKDEMSTGHYNRGYGTDANLRFGRSTIVNLFYAKTDTPDRHSQNIAFRLATAFRDRSWDLRSIYTDIGNNFNPEVGFMPVGAVKRLYDMGAWKYRPVLGSKWIREIAPTAERQVFWTQTNQMQTRYLDLRVPIFFQDGALLELGRNSNFERLFSPFRIQNDVSIPAGDYLFNDYFASYTTNSARKLAFNGKLDSGAFYGGRKQTYTAGGTIRLGYRMASTIAYERDNVRLPFANFKTDLLTMRMNYSFSTRTFLSGLIQYNTDLRQWSSNIRFNIIHRPLSDFFLVYNERRDSVSYSLLDRALIAKFTQMFGH